MPSRGRLKIECFKGENYIPLDGCKVTIKGFENRQDIQVTTDSSGLTEEVELDAPPVEYSLNKDNEKQPYSVYDLVIEKDNFEPTMVKGCQIFADQLAIQPCYMNESESRQDQVIDILPNTLFGDYPPKIPEEEDKPLPPPSSGVVLQKPVVPGVITVHQGSPNDASAPNYTVPFKNYIKNVASCEIYSTWSESTIRANVFCIISFTLNRIYTEWYRGKGKRFDVTSSTAYDHAFNYGRNIYNSISVVVDELFSTYIKRVNRKQPLLTQYCDGKNVSCPTWLSQWGSKYLGDEGKVPYEILTYYYGDNIELVTAEQVEGSPESYPGYDLTVGSTGIAVSTIQNQLNAISKNYPLIPKVIADGNFGPKTAESVKVFQGVFNLPKTGVVDYATWYKISDVYVAVTKIAELRGRNNKNIFIPPSYSRNRSIKTPSIYY
ncbi:peptidoglycan-binding domain-containing protein [Clostridium sp. BJN0001]|uniref:peptidoglycan-binding domain-containing protein n=1 Tax=Clostridium sp. BJN0001 TaxID=2930219 RepID=UPI001FD1537F|nr:peptidoglycan-binding domain-containing protein [Clostridium sp. BJN0001]